MLVPTHIWDLPPKQRDQIRVVFDSSFKHEGISLNDVLMRGPDLLNRLDGVLLRFRKEPIAIVADIQQMFFAFHVGEKHKDFLRFFWHRENDPYQELIEHRMYVHVCGNKPSPAVAIYGLRKCVKDTEVCGEDVNDFVTRNFYVDDCLASFPTPEQAVDILKLKQKALLSGGNIRLHKIASNSEDVILQFPAADLAKSIEPLELNRDDLPLHHSLGLRWDLANDTFTYNVSDEQKPFTKRGLLSTVNGLFDSLGFIAPVVLPGKLILRDVVADTKDWDDLIGLHAESSWTTWLENLTYLKDICIPRCILATSFSGCISRTIHIFSDASEQAVAACAYLRDVANDQTVHTGFVFGKCKVAPRNGHTIPRLEICAAVLAVEIGEILSEELRIPLADIRYYSESKVVLGYVSNERRRFFVYVCNRVSRIRNSSP